MKKNLAILCIFAISLLQAQPTLNSNNMNPVIGTNSTAISGTYSDTGQSLLSGADVTWDYSFLSGGAMSVSIVNPNSISFGSTLSSVTFASFYSSMNYDFFNVATDAYSMVGTYNNINSYAVYSDEINLIEFPCTYNTTFDDSFAWAGNNISGSGSFEAVADGWGTLILPWGTIDNVLRIRYDGTNIITNSSGSSQENYLNYMFFHPGTGLTLLAISIPENGPPSFYTTGEEIIGIDSPIAASSKLTVNPNPATDIVNIGITPEDFGGVLRICDSMGRMVSEHNITTASINVLTIDISSLADDVYTLSITNGVSRRNQRLIISHH